jgi:predicted ABC-type ATPase
VSAPYLIVVAGPNGSGKTTFAKSNLQQFIDKNVFLNADEIAREDNPGDVEAAAMDAGRKALVRRKSLVESGNSLGVETTLAGNSIRRFMQEAKQRGYIVRLVFLFTASPELNEARVMQRVMKGGHNVPVEDIHRRHGRGLQNLSDCWSVCDEGVIYDVRTRRLVEIIVKADGKTIVVNDETWAELRAILQAGGYRLPT